METRCMPFKITIEGQEIDAYLTEKNWELVHNLLSKNQKKTGYERVIEGEYYWIIDPQEKLVPLQERKDEADNRLYEFANYYGSELVAAQNARADKLMRQLRRFAVEHRSKEIDWNNHNQRKFYIGYDCKRKVFDVECDTDYITSHTVYFDSYEVAEDAMNVFANELKWYFTEYRDSL